LTARHLPVLCEETVSWLTGKSSGQASGQNMVREGVYVDATFGRGGHTRRLLEVLGSGSRVVAVDRDPEAVDAGKFLAAEDGRLQICHGRFSELDQLLKGLQITEVQGVLMDLGASSPQLDDARRGFSFRFDAPLDMRMDTSAGESAAEWLNDASEQDIVRVFREYGEERYARRVAAAIVAARPVHTTAELAALVSRAQPRSTPGKHDATRVFQAIRMQVNQELPELEAGLVAAFGVLRPGGRLAVISFHSLEDRLVKRFFRDRSRPPQLPRRLPVRAAASQAEALIVAGPLKPGESEIRANPRARSALLRVLEKAA
jgi:16S rRNA (cytosine1402-N4)-methyltransferase